MCPKKFALPKKFFVIDLSNQSNYPILNTIVVIKEKVLVVNFFVLSFFGNLLFVLKFTVIIFIIVSPIMKLDYGTVSVLFPTFFTFYKIYYPFGIAIRWFVNMINLSELRFLKIEVFFISLHNS